MEFQEKRKVADKSETVNGKPNPQYPRLRLEAEVAQMRYEMAYMVAKNKSLESRFELLYGLYERVSLLEGAYNFLTVGFENAKRMFQEALSKQASVAVRERKICKEDNQNQPKEQENGSKSH